MECRDGCCEDGEWTSTKTKKVKLGRGCEVGKGAELPPLTGAFVTCTITFDLTCRFRMLDMRWKALAVR